MKNIILVAKTDDTALVESIILLYRQRFQLKLPLFEMPVMFKTFFPLSRSYI